MNTLDMTERYQAYNHLLNTLENQNHTNYELFDEEINIVIHKLKFIPLDSRPKLVLISDVRTLSQDFSDLMVDAVEITGGQFLNIREVSEADKLIFVQNPQQLYNDIPYLLQQDEFKNSPAVVNNEIYIIQNEYFGTSSKERYLQDIEILAEIIQPKYFIYGHANEDWLKFDLG